MAADADPTSADVLGRAGLGSLRRQPPLMSQRQQAHVGLAAARAGTLRYLGPKRVHNADEIMARLSQALGSGDEEAAKR